MGSRMAANLLKGGTILTVYNRSAGPADELKASGISIASTPAEAVADADIVFSMLSKPEVVESVCLQQMLPAMQQHAIWADCSTVNPSFSRQCGELAKSCGVRFVDAPVAGSKAQAEQGELVFFVGGEEETISVLETHLQLMGKRVVSMGKVGMGASFKMLVNAMLAQSMLIFSEATVLGQKMGIDRDFLLQTLPSLAVSAPFTQAKAKNIKENNYDVQFPLELMLKDIHLACLTAYELGQPMYMANQSKEVFMEANKQGMGRMDFSAIHKYLEEQGT